MLKKLSPTPSKPSIMFRVDEDLRSINRKAYDPEIIAIGPFHHGNDEKFEKMEQHKISYLNRLLERCGESSVERYVNAIIKLEDEARKCYPENIVPGRDKFVQMLILDGCFVIEFLRKFQHKNYRDVGDPIFEYEHIQSHLLHDLMLFENQIPFSIINSLLNMMKINSLNSLIWPLLQNGIFPVQNLTQVLPSNSHHLLGIVHDIHCSSLSDHMKSGKSDNMVKINSAVELQEAGISFKKLKEKEDIINSLFYVKFRNKTMKIREWKISDSTESLFRNLIAYEYYLPAESSQRYVTDYVYLMNCLVRSSEDAKLLRRRGIISNLLGSDEMVYDVIKKLGKNTIISVKFSYFEIFSQVNSHCDHRWNRWMANLRRKYFNGPWAIISVLAAATLLVLTITQTVFAILSFCNDP